MDRNFHLAILYVVKHEHGRRERLESIFGEKIVIDLAKQGYISNGSTYVDMNSDSVERTWGITEKAQDYVKFNATRTISEESKKYGRFLYSLGIR